MERLYQYAKEKNMSAETLHHELTDYLNKASTIKNWNITKAALDFLNEKSENLNPTQIRMSTDDKIWEFINAMIEFYTLIMKNHDIKDWVMNNNYIGTHFLLDKMIKSNVTSKNLGSFLVKTLNLVLNLNDISMKKCKEKSYVDRLHQLFTIPGQTVNLPDIAYMYSIMDYREITKNTTFQKWDSGSFFYEPPESLISMKKSFVTCFRSVGNYTSENFQFENNFDEILITEKYMKKSPCSELTKYSQCKEYCNWHKDVFNKWSREEFLTVMRYSMPQRKLSLDPILPFEKNIANKLFGSKNVKELDQRIAPMSMSLFCKRNDIGYHGDNINLSEKVCNDFFPAPTDVGICLTRNMDIKEVLHKEKYFDIQFEAEKQPKNQNMEAMSFWSTTTLIIFTDSLNSLRQTYPRKPNSKVDDIKFQLHQPKEIGQVSQIGNYDFYTNSLTLKNGYEYYIDVTPTGLVSTESFKDLTIQQRNCFLENEIENFSIFKKYTLNNCKYQCHVAKAKEECQCIPWDFMNNASTEMEECDVFGRTCFFNRMEYLTQSRKNYCDHCLKGKCPLDPFKS